MGTEVDVAATTSTRVGWIGTGIMGSSMASHLLAAGYPTTVTSRTRSRADPLVAAGAVWADTPTEVAAVSEVIFTMLGEPSDIRQVVLGGGGVLEGARAGTVLVDMTTSEPTLAVEIAAAAAAKGVDSLDAPVSGGDVGARDATLSIMVGGDERALERARPCLERLGTTIVHQGGPGAGQHTKMVNQILIAGTMVGLCEALVYAHAAGQDLELVLQSVASGAAGSWSLSNLAPRILAGDLEPGFLVEHFVKDLGIALAEARGLQLALPGLALAHQLYVGLLARGHGRSGTQALITTIASLSGVDWQSR